MSQIFSIHPTHPQGRLIKQAAGHLRDEALIVYPTDSSYALGWRVGAKAPMDRAMRLRGKHRGHQASLVCRNLSELATYAKVGNSAYRYLRAHTPGPFTFILPATREVPKRLLDPKRRTVGLRVPAHPVVEALLDELGEPMMSSTLLLPDDELPLSEPDAIREQVARHCDVILDAGTGGTEFTTVVDLTEDVPVLVRQGMGEATGAEPGFEPESSPQRGGRRVV